jgi:hypothetical protein
MTKAITLKADTINGVQEIDIFDEEDCENIHIMKANDFYNSLSNLDNDDVIYTQIDDNEKEILDAIKEGYDIH